MKMSLPFLNLPDVAEIKFHALSMEEKESVRYWMESNALFFSPVDYSLHDMIRFLESFIDGDAMKGGYVYYPNPADKDEFFYIDNESIIEYLDDIGIEYNS